MKIKTYIKSIILLGLFLAVFSPIFPALYARFSARDSYYSHGFLVPAVVLYLVWRKRKVIKSIPVKSEGWGIFVVLSGLILHLVSVFLKINFTSYFAVPVVLLGMVLYLGGREITKQLFFPILFLIFMLPLPKVMIIGISFRLKILAAQGAALLAKYSGFSVDRVGSTIYYPKGSLIVGDPCSGLRSLISFIALGSVFSQLTNAPLWKKNIILLATVPIALLSNLVRITTLLFISYIYGEQAVSGFIHDASGIMVFILGFAGFLILIRILKCPVTVDSI